VTDVSALQAPDLPELEEVELDAAAGAVEVSGALIVGDGLDVRAQRVRARESELRGVVLQAGNVPGLTLADVDA
jgi:hypothetical protein